jgi:hypothetical protein
LDKLGFLQDPFSDMEFYLTAGFGIVLLILVLYFFMIIVRKIKFEDDGFIAYWIYKNKKYYRINIISCDISSAGNILFIYRENGTNSVVKLEYPGKRMRDELFDRYFREKPIITNMEMKNIKKMRK